MLSPTLFLPYVLLAVVVTVVAAWRARTPKRRWWTAAGLLVFFVAFAHIDDILGGIQHKWLCNEEAGFWVYKPVKLPKELYDAAGKPRFMTARGPDKEMLRPYLAFEWSSVNQYRQSFLEITKRSYRVTNRKTGELLAEIVTFSAWPSKFIPTFAHVGAYRCANVSEEIPRWREWEKKLFDLK